MYVWLSPFPGNPSGDAGPVPLQLLAASSGVWVFMGVREARRSAGVRDASSGQTRCSAC